jgi:inhibitor of cysteine peptidase
MVTLTHVDSGKTIHTKVGDIVAVRLEENLSTGYKWALEERHDGVVALQRVEYVRAQGGPVGGGGQRLWRFTMTQTGQTVVQLKLWREWEGEASIMARFRVTLHIQP